MRRLGHVGKIRIKTDGEHALVDLRKAVTKKLKPPHFWNGRQDIPDLITCFVGFGPSGAPGALNIKLTPGPELALSTHHAAFSVDSLYSRLAGKQSPQSSPRINLPFVFGRKRHRIILVLKT